MKEIILSIITFLWINLVGFAQVQITTQDGTYKLDKVSSDFIRGKIMYESKKYKEPEKYEKDRIIAIEKITESAESGYAPAQYYLGTIYLNDTLIKDYNKAIGYLKKSAYQRNGEAMEMLDRLGEEYAVANDYQFWFKTFTIGLLALIYFVLATIAHRKIGNSKLITLNHKKRLKKITWLMPYFGAFIGLYRHKKVIVPLDNESIEWVNESFNWMINEFGRETLINSEIMTPVISKIPVKLNSSEFSAKELVYFVAFKMEINPDLIDVDFYNESQMELDGSLNTQQYDKENYSAGQYWGKSESGNYLISIEKSKLNNPIALIATVAHELAHIKLLGEERISENDEYLTDLIPIIYGFGIFSANSIFRFQQDAYGWRTVSQGYLNERLYGFALAKFALYRNDFEPNWSAYLAPTIREEFERGMIYIKENEVKRLYD